MHSDPNIVESAARLALSQSEPQTVEGITVFVHSKDSQITSLEGLRLNPVRAHRQVTLHDLPSFVMFAASQQTANAMIRPFLFADRHAKSLKLFPEYHGNEESLSWLDNSAYLKVEPSRELAIWKAKENHRFSQVEFAEFIDENVGDIARPSGSEMLTIAQTLEATRTETFKSAVRVSNGDIQFAWNSEATGASDTRVPDKFYLAIPIFDGDPQRIEVQVKLYYRIHEGKLSFFFKLYRLQDVMDTLWQEMVSTLSNQLMAITADTVVLNGAAPTKPTPTTL